MPWKRRPFRGTDPSRALSIADLREIARRRIPNIVFEYVEGGADDEATLRRNRAALEALHFVARAAAAGYEALVFTTDANVFGNREWDRRNYRGPGKPTLRNLFDTLRHPRWLYEVLVRDGWPQFENFAEFLPPGGASAVGGSTIIPKLFDASI